MSLGQQVLTSDVHFCAWADQLLLAACSALTADELSRDFRISHTSIVRTLHHYYDGQRVWLDCLRTTPDGGSWRLPIQPSPQLSLDALKLKWPALWQGFGEWIEHQTENRLEIELTLFLPGEVTKNLPRWKILRHVLDHSIKHRGQVVGMIRMLGHPPPNLSPMDYYLSS